MSVAPLPGIQPIIMSRPQVGIERLPSRRMGNEPREAMNCKSCRKRKIKCNRLRPSCEACQVFQCPCIYDAVPKKRGPKTDVLEALLKRVDGLEAQLKDHKRGDALPSTEKLTHINTEETSSGGRPAAGDDSDPGPRSKRPTLDISRATEIASESAIYSPTIASEPSPGIQIDAFLDTYFSRFHAKPYHILDESSVRQRLQLNQLPGHLIYAIYSVAARYTTHPSGCQSATKLSEEYALRSRSEIDEDEPSIDTLQTLLLLVTAFTAAGKGKKAYMLLTIAIGMAMALELHREVDLHARITAVEREMRRRLFWTCYLLDRFMACGSKRPCLISDRTILLRLPCWSPNPSTLPVEGDFFQNGSNLQHLQGNGRKSQGSSGMLIDISRILGFTNRYLAAGGVKGDSHFPWHALSELSKIRQDLEIWASGTADVFSSVDTLFGQPDSTVLVLSKLVYHLIHCLIYRPFLPIDLAELAGTGQHQSWQIEATNICFLHANAIAELVELGRQMPSIEWPAFVGYCICTAGTVHIHGAHYHKNGGGEALGVLSSSSEFLSRELQQLSELSYTWASVQHQRDTLQSIYSAHAELVKGLANNSMRYSPAFNLEDFFDRYSNISRPGGRPFSFDATNLSFSDITTSFATDTYPGPDLYSPRMNGDFERPNLKRKNTAISQRRPDIRNITPINVENNRPLTPGLPTPDAHSRHFSFSTTPLASSIVHPSSSLLSHRDNLPNSTTQSVRQRRETIDSQVGTGGAGAGFNPGNYQPPQPQIEAISTVSFSPSYQYATPSPSGDNESSLGVASYDPMFGTVPTNTFSSPTPWHGEEDHQRKPPSHLTAVPSPGAGSHNGSPATTAATTAPGEDKDPFLSLLEQLAENEHAIGQGKEIDFFSVGAQE
ncbi:fungal-specific transcription factor domain-containing protein [Daldinia bambusicola]|nr:fungal-specific transcription factor domain-containing protein [Daldinia bambusicola]